MTMSQEVQSVRLSSNLLVHCCNGRNETRPSALTVPKSSDPGEKVKIKPIIINRDVVVEEAVVVGEDAADGGAEGEAVVGAVDETQHLLLCK